MPSPMPAGQYSHAAQAWHASFSPFVVFVDGLSVGYCSVSPSTVLVPVLAIAPCLLLLYWSQCWLLLRVSFYSVDGLLALEAQFTVQRFADRLPLNGANHTMKWWCGCKPDCHLRSYNKPMCAWIKTEVEEHVWWGRACPDYEQNFVVCCILIIHNYIKFDVHFFFCICIYIHIYINIVLFRVFLYHFCWPFPLVSTKNCLSCLLIIVLLYSALV